VNLLIVCKYIIIISLCFFATANIFAFESISLKEAQTYLEKIKKHSYKEPFLSWQEREWVSFLRNLNKLPKLQGIIITDKNKKAIFDGKSIKEGETIYGFKIIKIKKKCILLRKGKKIYKISLK